MWADNSSRSLKDLSCCRHVFPCSPLVPLLPLAPNPPWSTETNATLTRVTNYLHLLKMRQTFYRLKAGRCVESRSFHWSGADQLTTVPLSKNVASELRSQAPETHTCDHSETLCLSNITAFYWIETVKEGWKQIAIQRRSADISHTHRWHKTPLRLEAVGEQCKVIVILKPVDNISSFCTCTLYTRPPQTAVGKLLFISMHFSCFLQSKIHPS